MPLNIIMDFWSTYCENNNYFYYAISIKKALYGKLIIQKRDLILEFRRLS